MRLGSPGRRLRGGTLLLAVLLGIITLRLVQLQGFQSAAYARKAEGQRSRHIPQLAERGNILDRSGNVLAGDVDAFDVVADPKQIQAASVAAAELAPLLGRTQGDLVGLLQGPGDYVRLRETVTPAVARQVMQLGIVGIDTRSAPKRIYPNGDVAANIVGFTGTAGTGLAGLESAYDKQLAGKNGELLLQVDPSGRAIPTAPSRETAPVQGQTLSLTLDRDLQYTAQQAVAAQVAKSHAAHGVAIVMDPHTGDILAMASTPTFDPNSPSAANPADYGNLATSWAYEPGSVAKIVTIATALDKGAVTPTTVVNVPPYLDVGGARFHDAEAHGAERLTTAGILARSSNLGTLLISRMLGSTAALEQALRNFGLGQTTGLGFPGESPGILHPSSQWSDSTAANVSFGQGMSVTALQVASMYSTVANGGVRVAPRLLRGIVAGDGTLTPAPTQPTRRVIGAAADAELSAMLEGVTTTDGTAPAAAIPGYRVAGKTGTAARIGVNGGYAGYVASFVGFAPADHPRYVVAVVIDNPQGNVFGGTVAAPVFRTIMSYALARARVAPSGTLPVRFPLTG